jgi:copper(I)-binding protein
MYRKNMLRLFYLLIFGSLAACTSTGGELVVLDVWARPGIAGGNSAVYFTIDNPNAPADSLLQAASDVAERVEIHLSKSGADGVMIMEQQESVPVEGNSAVLFAPGGLHIMLVGLSQDMIVGETFSLRLQFEKAGEIALTVPVEER